MGTLRTLVRRAYDICLKYEHLQNELNHIKNVFYEQNQYPFWAVNEVFCEVKRRNHQQLQNNSNNKYHLTHHMKKYQISKKFLLLPYKEKRADNITKSMKKTVDKLLRKTVNTQLAYTGKTLGP